MPQVCEAMQSELDNFRDTSLTELMDVISGENDHLQDLIASVFCYWLAATTSTYASTLCLETRLVCI